MLLLLLLPTMAATLVAGAEPISVPTCLADVYSAAFAAESLAIHNRVGQVKRGSVCLAVLALPAAVVPPPM